MSQFSFRTCYKLLCLFSIAWFESMSQKTSSATLDAQVFVHLIEKQFNYLFVNPLFVLVLLWRSKQGSILFHCIHMQVVHQFDVYELIMIILLGTLVVMKIKMLMHLQHPLFIVRHLSHEH